MRKLLLALACVFAVSAQAQVPVNLLIPSPIGIVITVGSWILQGNKKLYYIEVEGRGATQQEARENGFRLAVEQAIGTVIASETEVRQGRITRDEIISYAAGHVDHFEITSTTGNTVRMRVWVARSVMSERLLVKSETDTTIPGERASVAVGTINYANAQGDRLTGTVLRDWPHKSFDVRLEPSTVTQDAYRNAMLTVPVVLQLNTTYADSVFESMQIRRNQQVDQVRLQQLATAFIGSEPVLEITILNRQKQRLISQCYQVPELDHQPRYQVPDQYFVEFRNQYLAMNTRLKLSVPIQIPVTAQSLEAMDSVVAKIIRKSECK